MEVPQRFCVRWNSYKSNLQTAFPKLLTSEHFVDVTLACEKQYIKCHKIVLSACSVYFETLLVNNPCQHPIIFMKDVQFWEIKALVEFMYKGEVNVSQNQLDSLLKSAESLQIRGLSGTKQFINFEQSEENHEDSGDVKDDSRSKRSKSDNEEVEEESCKRKKSKRNEEEEKCVQITSVRGADELAKEKRLEETGNEVLHPGQKVIKEENPEHEDFDFDNNYDPGEEEENEEFSQDVFYPDHSSDPGPSGISDLCSLALNNVECVMDQDKAKSSSSSPTNIQKQSMKPLQRHQEHNYTNPPVDDTNITITKLNVTNEPSPSNEGENHRVRNSAFKIITPTQIKVELGDATPVSPRPIAIRPGASSHPEKPPLEPKSKVIRKDVFNRIRRSEEELQKAAEMVRGGMTFQTASDTFNIPISTIRFYMARRGILPQRRRGRGSSGVRDDDLIHPPFEIIHYRLPDIDKPL